MPSPKIGDVSADYRSAVLEVAATICRDGLVGDRRDRRLFHLSGLLAARDRQHDVASAYLKRAVQLNAGTECYIDLSDALQQAGRDAEAIAALLCALRSAPDAQGLYGRLGRILHHQCRLMEAVAAYREALRLTPADAVLHGELGDVLLAQGKLCDAIEHYETQLRLDPLGVDGYYRLGMARLCSGASDQALASFRRGLHLKYSDVKLRVAIGEALIRLGSLQEAVENIRSALTIEPTNVDACRLLVHAMELLGRRGDAVGAWLTLGEALQIEGRYPEAANAYREALVRKADCLPAASALGHMLIALREPREAISTLTAALALDSQNIRARVDLATAFHLTGDLEHGWDEFMWFYHLQGTPRREFEQPVWDGSPLDGRTVLLWTSLGRGDTIQFLRYISFVKSLSGRVLVQCHHAGLVELVERIPGVDRVLVPGAPLPSFDVHAPLVFLPAFVRASRSLVDNRPSYLSVDANSVDAWRRRLAPQGHRLIGLSWGGNVETAPSRFVSLMAFAALADVPGARFISLQHGPQAAELLTPPRGLRVETLMNECSSITDAAALILNLDLVISVDTMIAHLAGALGQPVWTLLRYATNWRWLADGDRTPWYPTMRLFRQTNPGDWPNLFRRVRVALNELP